jgi:hypothetical protein
MAALHHHQNAMPYNSCSNHPSFQLLIAAIFTVSVRWGSLPVVDPNFDSNLDSNCNPNFDSNFDSMQVLLNLIRCHLLQMEQLQAELLSSGQALGAGVQLLLLLTKFRFGLAAEDFELLRASLSPAVLEGAEVSAAHKPRLACLHCINAACRSDFESGSGQPQPSSAGVGRGVPETNKPWLQALGELAVFVLGLHPAAAGGPASEFCFLPASHGRHSSLQALLQGVAASSVTDAVTALCCQCQTCCCLSVPPAGQLGGDHRSSHDAPAAQLPCTLSQRCSSSSAAASAYS